MGALNDSTQDLKEEAVNLAREAKTSTWLDWGARLGYAVRGTLFGLMGLMTLWFVLRGFSEVANYEEVLWAIATQPLGKIGLLIIAAGAVGMILWTIVLAVADPYRRGSHATGILARLSSLVAGSYYVIVLIPTLSLIFGAGRMKMDGEQQAQQAAAGVLAQPWGPWLVGSLGVVLVVIAIIKFNQGLAGQFIEQLKEYDLNSYQIKLITRMGKVGILAQAVVLLILGTMIILAAWTVDPQKVGGMDGALTYVAQQTYGPWLLALVAIGLIAYSIFLILGALWFKFKEL